METLQEYERAAYGMLQDANEAGLEAPAVVSINAFGRFFIVPRAAFHDARKAIISAGASYRASFI